MMKYLIFVNFLQLWSFGFTSKTTEKPLSLLLGAKTAVDAAVEGIDKGLKKLSLDKIISPDCIEPPLECPNKNITFWYYTRNHQNNPIEISVSNLQSLNNIEKNQNPWKIMVHGYTKSKDEIPNPELRSAYFQRGEYNLISVDYAPIARDKCYLQAVHNVPLIANCTAQMIDALVDKNFFKMDELHAIGFSLGAQIVGQLRDYLKHGRPNRVTGLDPASPLFDGVVNTKITKESGDFVDAIHTNALIKGKLEPLGHVDFYVNGGVNQPGCFSDSSKSLSTCNHDRSPLYFAESINSKEGFWGVPCPSLLKCVTGQSSVEEKDMMIMGEYIPHTARGIYYLKTTDKAPFALGKSIVSENSK